MKRPILPLLLVGTLLLPLGCIRRTLSITSTPPDALVWVNHREVGRTPLAVDFTHYGTYDIRIEREGMEPVLTSRKASAPLWDLPGPDFVFEVMPFQSHSKVEWHFDLEPRDESSQSLLERARNFRNEARGMESGQAGNQDVETMNLNGTVPVESISESPEPSTDAISQ